jgi:hypothetical protein
MRRVAAFFVAVLLTLAACGDPGVQPNDRSEPRPTAAPVSAQSCSGLDYTALRAAIGALFANGSPNKSSALGKFDNIQHHITIGNIATAKDHTWNLVDFILEKHAQGSLVAPAADVAAVVNELFCFVGITVSIGGPDNSFVVLPTDGPQTLVTNDGFAGTDLPGAVVTEPTLIEITRIDETAFPVGDGPLTTNLDQYPLYYTFLQSNDGNTGFTQSVVVGVCPATGIDPAVLARLRLGHNATAGFEITPPAPADFLVCDAAPPLPASMAMRALRWATDLAASVLLPEKLQASAFVVGGVGGSASDFSPFGPVDPKLTAVGGVGGSASEFAPPAQVTTLCPPVEAPIGADLPPACRPEVEIVTFLGTKLQSVPVAFTVLSGGGQVAEETPTGCLLYGGSAVVPTGTNGKARACWKLGLTPGTNTAEGRPGPGGDAVAGVTFSPPAFVFTATANPPTQLGFLTEPSQALVGVPLIPVQVAVQDKNGVTVEVSTDAVTMGLTSGSFTSGSTTTVNAVAGIATFTNLVTTTATTSVALVASSPGLTSATGTPFTVSPGAPTVMTKVAGDNQTVPAGTAVPIPPSVKVTDQYGNPIAGETVNFAPQNNAAPVTGPVQVTDAAGIATLGSWTLLDGVNRLIATLAANPLVFTTFTGTGTTTLATVNSCAPSGSSDPVTYPFWIPGTVKQVRQVQLYLSSNGPVNTPTTYRIQLRARIDSYNRPVVASSTVDVTLTGSTSPYLPTQFRFPTPIVSGTPSKEIAFELAVLSNPDGATISYDTGPCGLGTGCVPPRSCKVTQVGATTPYPLGTLRRKSVGIDVLAQ